jgi:type I restriction enzyme S subunit
MRNEQISLPDGWAWGTIGDIADFLDNLRVPVSAKQREKRIANKPSSVLYPYYGANGQVGWIDKYIFDQELILLAEDGGFFGDKSKFIAYRINGKSWVNNHAHVLKPRQGIEARYLQFVLNDCNIMPYVRGTTRLKLNQSDAKKIRVALPPSFEQKRIVTKVEALFAESKTAREAVNRVPILLKRFRQSILNKAFAGELTQRNSSDTPAQELIDRIKATRCSKKSAQYSEDEVEENKSFPTIPKSWAWSKFGSLFDVAVGSTPKRNSTQFWGGDIPWVSSSEVAFCRIKATREQITEEGMRRSNLHLRPPGTILLAMIGEGKTRGQCAILDIKAATNQNIASIIDVDSYMPSEYVYYWLMSQYEETRCSGEGGAQPALNSQRVRQIPIPIAPLEEQKRIVIKIQELFAIADAILDATNIAKKSADKIDHSLLAKAFRGELVPQDPNDEPASVLLQRVKAG